MPGFGLVRLVSLTSRVRLVSFSFSSPSAPPPSLPALSQGIASKDRDLQSILASRRGLIVESAGQAASLDALYTQAHREIQEWMQLTEGMESQIQQMRQTCRHCAVALSAQAANTRCAVSRGLHAFVPNGAMQPQYQLQA